MWTPSITFSSNARKHEFKRYVNFWAHLKGCRLISARSTVWGVCWPPKSAASHNCKILQTNTYTHTYIHTYIHTCMLCVPAFQKVLHFNILNSDFHSKVVNFKRYRCKVNLQIWCICCRKFWSRCSGALLYIELNGKIRVPVKVCFRQSRQICFKVSKFQGL